MMTNDDDERRTTNASLSWQPRPGHDMGKTAPVVGDPRQLDPATVRVEAVSRALAPVMLEAGGGATGDGWEAFSMLAIDAFSKRGGI